MMKTFVGAALLAGASAATIPSCTFQITASGGASGVVGQLGDGQNRVGGNHPAGTYSISSNGGITDAQGRGCILTPPTTQFQCDVGASPTTGFAVSSNGDITYNGSNVFYACPASGSEYNIYTKPVANQSKCVTVTLSTGGKCIPAPPAQPTTPSTPAQSACPTTLSGPYQYPHLIVPVSSSQPNKAFGTQYNATITPDECTIFNFDIPASYSGKQCSAVFLFPQQSQLQTSSYTFSGSGQISFSQLSSAANQQTTYANAPSKKSQLATISAQPGNSYVVSTGACSSGTTQSIEACSTGGLSLSYFQDYNPSPIGLYITSC